MITQHGWMFLSSFEKLRNIIKRYSTVNMLHLGPRAFDEISGEVVQSTAFVMMHRTSNKYKGLFSRLLSGMSETEKRSCFSLPNATMYHLKKTMIRFPDVPLLIG